MSKNHFILTAVEALPDYRLRLVYADGQILQVDLADWIDTTQALAAPRDAAQVASVMSASGTGCTRPG